jgi:hypothetical protein
MFVVIEELPPQFGNRDWLKRKQGRPGAGEFGVDLRRDLLSFVASFSDLPSNRPAVFAVVEPPGTVMKVNGDSVLIAVRKRATFAAWEGARGSCRARQFYNRDLDAGPCSLGVEPRYCTTNSRTEIDSSRKQGLLRSGSIEIEVIPGRSAAKTLIDVSP